MSRNIPRRLRSYPEFSPCQVYGEVPLRTLICGPITIARCRIFLILAVAGGKCVVIVNYFERMDIQTNSLESRRTKDAIHASIVKFVISVATSTTITCTFAIVDRVVFLGAYKKYMYVKWSSMTPRYSRENSPARKVRYSFGCVEDIFEQYMLTCRPRMFSSCSPSLRMPRFICINLHEQFGGGWHLSRWMGRSSSRQLFDWEFVRESMHITRRFVMPLQVH